MKKLVGILLVLNFSISFGQSKMENIALLMKTANEIGIFNGNIIISENNKIIYQEEFGFSDFTKSKKLTRDSTMPIGSITKEFSSTGILLLAEKGKLNLEDKISDYLPYLPDWAKKIQIKHLLQYTSGLPALFKNTDSDYLEALNKVEKLEFEPGTGYIYSNANIFLQQEIIKKVSNLSFDLFLRNILFSPLKIKGGTIPANSLLAKDMAGSFDNDYKETTFIHGGGEMYFSINDLYNWVNGLHNKKIVSENSLNILARSFDKNSESSLGNTIIKNNRIVEHSHQGSGNNYESYIFHLAQKNTTIVLMTNNQNFKLSAISESLINILSDRPFTVPKKSIYLDIRGKLLDNFENGMAFYKKIKDTQSSTYELSDEADDLISTGKYLMRRNRFEDAVKILEISTTIDLKKREEISEAYLLMGECYDKMKMNDFAILNLKKALEFDSDNNNAEEMLKRITSIQ